MKNYNCVSLFSSAGIGELGIHANNIKTIISNELLEDRHKVYKNNFPMTKLFTGDIWDLEKDISDYYKNKFSGQNLFLLHATPPCQGMSTNGAGKLISEVRKGNRPIEDKRNRLIIPTIKIIKDLMPEWILLENVPNMVNTLIRDENNQFINIMVFIRDEIPENYYGRGEVINCADYGIPQNRKRLITIYTRNPLGKEYFENEGTFFPNKQRIKKSEWITLKDAIGHLPELEAIKGKESRTDFNEFHYVPVLNKEKYRWIKNTPKCETAFSNQCDNPNCLEDTNIPHGTKIKNGVHQSNIETPIYCKSCNELLPRPTMLDKKTNKIRIIKGFKTAYKRMDFDKPSPTLTQNFQYEASDNKIHPTQNRVLSLYEALLLQGIIDYKFDLKIEGKTISRHLTTEIIGESVPPKLIDIICQNIIKITSGDMKSDKLKLNF